MTTKRLVILLALGGGAFGMGLDAYFAMVNDWGFAFMQNILCGAFSAFAFGGAAKMSLSKGRGESSRVEQVTESKRRAEDCYESVVVEQKEY